jgi:hypothetical protein
VAPPSGFPFVFIPLPKQTSFRFVLVHSMSVIMATRWQAHRDTPLTRIQNEMDLGRRLLYKLSVACRARRLVGTNTLRSVASLQYSAPLFGLEASIDGPRCCVAMLKLPQTLTNTMEKRASRETDSPSAVNKFISSYRTRMFITMFITARELPVP